MSCSSRSSGVRCSSVARHNEEAAAREECDSRARPDAGNELQVVVLERALGGTALSAVPGRVPSETRWLLVAVAGTGCCRVNCL